MTLLDTFAARASSRERNGDDDRASGHGVRDPPNDGISSLVFGGMGVYCDELDGTTRVYTSIPSAAPTVRHQRLGLPRLARFAGADDRAVVTGGCATP